MKKYLIFIQICIISITVMPQWSTNPYNNLRVTQEGVLALVIPADEGNTKVAFSIQNYYSGKFTGYFQMVDKYGYLKWNEAKLVCNGPYPNSACQAIFNIGSNSTLLCYISGNTWIDSLGPQIYYYEPYIQKLDSNGNRQWGYYGFKINEDINGRSLNSFRFCQDKNEDIFSALYYDRFYSGPYHDSLYIQKISKEGERLWGDNGVFVEDSISSTNSMWVIPDDNGGIYINYKKRNYEYYIQKFDSHGKLNWTTVMMYSPYIAIKDGEGGIIVSYVYASYPVYSLRINRISPSGEKLWGEEGVIIDDSVDNSYYQPALLCLNNDNTITAFWDNAWYYESEIFLQRFDLAGNPLWETNNITSDSNTIKVARGITISDNNSNIIMFGDARNPTGLYTQRVDIEGKNVWNNDKAITYVVAGIGDLISDGNGGGVAYYETQETGLWGIYLQQISKYGNLGEVITSLNEEDKNNLPEFFTLYQNYPNPFNPSTTIKFEIPTDSKVSLKIYDILGREITTLVNQQKPPGEYQVTFDATDLPSGIYFIRMNAGNYSQTIKTILMK